MDRETKIITIGGLCVLVALTYTFGITFWHLPYPCSGLNIYNDTLCRRCAYIDFQCKCNDYGLWDDSHIGDCSFCPNQFTPGGFNCRKPLKIEYGCPFLSNC